MYLVDTNYLVRLAVNDDLSKTQEIANFLKKSQESNKSVIASLVSIFEVFWVLENVYKWEYQSIINFLEKIYKSKLVDFENEQVIVEALSLSRVNNLGVEDNYNIAFAIHNSLEFRSYDKKAVKFYHNLVKKY
jgi:predicted nucleic-acid-binding protein